MLTPMNKLDILRQPVAAELEQYQALFAETLAHDDDYLGQVLGHIRMRKGKMMRPLLTLLVARELGAVNLPTLRAAITLELLHTASLVHDDVVDDSDKRRGQASANQIFGNEVAVLVGDYILSLSLQQAAKTGSLECVEIIARLGATLSEGEVFQLANIRKEEASEEAYFKVIEHKTAALFMACAELGARTAGADEDFIQVARDFGKYIGICFQIRDDIFDYYDDANIGKPTGSDMAEGKLTLPVLYVLKNTQDAEILQLAAQIKAGEASAEDIRSLVKIAIAGGGIEYAQAVMEEYRKKAERCLTAFKNAEVREALNGYLNYVIGRDF